MFLQEVPLPLFFNKFTVSTERVQRGLSEASTEHTMDLTRNGHRRTAAFTQAVIGRISMPKGIVLLVRAEENQCFLCLLLTEL